MIFSMINNVFKEMRKTPLGPFPHVKPPPIHDLILKFLKSKEELLKVKNYYFQQKVPYSPRRYRLKIENVPRPSFLCDGPDPIPVPVQREEVFDSRIYELRASTEKKEDLCWQLKSLYIKITTHKNFNDRIHYSRMGYTRRPQSN